MNAPMQPGWYPDPHDDGALRYHDGRDWTDQTNPPTPGAPESVSTPAPPKRSVPTWAWAAGTVVVLAIAAIVTMTQLGSSSRSEAESPVVGETTTSTTPRLNPLQSKTVPEVVFPRGSLLAPRQTGGPEIWGVPLAFEDAVRVLRPMLPVGFEYDGMPWGTETSDVSKTVWQWGAAPAVLTVTVNRNNAQSTNVYLERTP